MYKFSRYVNFEDVTNPAFSQFFQGLPTLRKFADFVLIPRQPHMTSSCISTSGVFCI